MAATGTTTEERASGARRIVDGNLYMVLATADEAGRPWATPVYFAHSNYREFFWISSPQATHSRNIGTRPQVGIVIFDSQVPIGSGQGVYVEGMAGETPADDLERGIGIFSRRSLATGGAAFTAADVREDAPFRLYRAIATEHSMLAKDGSADHRVPVVVAPPT
jgi:pyridoxine/pyridoxamine 5'-phosphate oxidase